MVQTVKKQTLHGYFKNPFQEMKAVMKIIRLLMTRCIYKHIHRGEKICRLTHLAMILQLFG